MKSNKLLCKKDLVSNKCIFLSGKYYDILEFNDTSIGISFEYQNFKTYNDRYFLSLNKETSNTTIPYAYDFFYTPIEERKLKLEKINQNN